MRVRKKVRGTSSRPRLSVYKTNHHISAQIIDDETGQTLLSYGTLSKELKNTDKGKKQLKSVAKMKNWEFKLQICIENQKLGLRVWRTM